MTGWFVRDGHEIVARLSPEEAGTLRRLVGQSRDLMNRPVDRADPALARLFPDAYPDSPADSAEFRRLTEGEQRAGKLECATVVLHRLPADGGGEVRLPEPEAVSWMRALNDLRLVIGTRLDLDDDTDLPAELDREMRRDPGSERAANLAVYAYLGYIQESLVEAVADW